MELYFLKNEENERNKMDKLRTITNEELMIIYESHSRWLAGTIGGIRADLSYADLSEKKLWGLNFSYADFSFAYMRGCNLYSCDFSHAKMIGTNLSFSFIAKSVFTETDLTEANINNSILCHSKLVNTKLKNTSLIDVTLSDVDFSDVEIRQRDLKHAIKCGAKYNNNMKIQKTQYGFKWGSAEIQRDISDEDGGWVSLFIISKKQRFHVVVMKGGKIKITELPLLDKEENE